jgi:hypothetical protein
MINEYLEIGLFVTAIALMMLGFPVAFTLAGVALAFALLGAWLGVFQFRQLNFLPQRMFGVLSNEVLIAAPLFIYMGLMLERSRVAEDLLLTMTRMLRGLRGGLALSVVLVGMLLAASTGIVGATVVTMGLIALPVMLRQGYDPEAGHGRHLRVRNAGADHPAVHRAGVPGRHPDLCQPAGEPEIRQCRGQFGGRGRPVCRLAGAGAAAGGVLCGLCADGGLGAPRQPRPRWSRMTKAPG